MNTNNSQTNIDIIKKDYRDYFDYKLQKHIKTIPIKTIIISSISLICICYLFNNYYIMRIGAAALVGLALYIPIIYIQNYFSFRSFFKQYKKYIVDFTISHNEEKIIFTTNEYIIEYLWQDFKYYELNNNAVYLYIKKSRNVLILSTECMIKSNFDNIISILQQSNIKEN